MAIIFSAFCPNYQIPCQHQNHHQPKSHQPLWLPPPTVLKDTYFDRSWVKFNFFFGLWFCWFRCWFGFFLLGFRCLLRFRLLRRHGALLVGCFWKGEKETDRREVAAAGKVTSAHRSLSLSNLLKSQCVTLRPVTCQSLQWGHCYKRTRHLPGYFKAIRYGIVMN